MQLKVLCGWNCSRKILSFGQQITVLVVVGFAKLHKHCKFCVGVLLVSFLASITFDIHCNIYFAVQFYLPRMFNYELFYFTIFLALISHFVQLVYYHYLKI